MQLIRFGPAGAERPGVQLPDGRRIDASGFGEDYDEAFFGGDGLERLPPWGGPEGTRAPEGGAGGPARPQGHGGWPRRPVSAHGACARARSSAPPSTPAITQRNPAGPSPPS